MQTPKATSADTSEITHVAGICSNSPDTSLGTWVIDSGATSHICHDRTLFSSMQPVDNISVVFPTQYRFMVEYIGTVNLSPDIILTEVLNVPDFSYNLLSVSTLIKHSSHSVNFCGASCLIQDKSGLRTIGKVDLVNGLYLLNVPMQQEATVLSCTSTFETWHQRMGHPSYERLNSMKNLLSLNTALSRKHEFCRVCPLAKQRRLSFSSNNHVAQHIFDLVHCDI